jgi:hypothetical protein
MLHGCGIDRSNWRRMSGARGPQMRLVAPESTRRGALTLFLLNTTPLLLRQAQIRTVRARNGSVVLPHAAEVVSCISDKN